MKQLSYFIRFSLEIFETNFAPKALHSLQAFESGKETFEIVMVAVCFRLLVEGFKRW